MTLDVQTSALTDIEQGMAFLVETQTGQGVASEIADAIMTFDPYWLVRNEYIDADADIDEDMDEGGHTDMVALQVARECFPDLYVQGLDLIQTDITWSSFVGTMISRIEREIGMDIIDPYYLSWGIPTPSFAFLEFHHPDYGMYLDDYRIESLLRWFKSSPDEPFFEMPNDQSRTQLHILFAYLSEHHDPNLINLSHLIGWVFGISQNVMVDYTGIDFHEGGFEPAKWNREEFKVYREILEEAEEIIANKDEALDWLWSDAHLCKHIQLNIESVIHDNTKPEQLCWRTSPPSIRTISTTVSPLLLRSLCHPQKNVRKRRNDRICHRPRFAGKSAVSKGRIQYRTTAPRYLIRSSGRRGADCCPVSQTTNHRHLVRRYGSRAQSAIPRARYATSNTRGQKPQLQYLRRQKTSNIPRRCTLSSPAA